MEKCKNKEILDKIAHHIQHPNSASGELVVDKKDILLKYASVAIQKAADKQHVLEEKIASFELENKKLKDEFEFLEKEKKVDKLVKAMFDNSLIRKDEIQSKKEHLITLNFEELSLLEENVSNTPKRDKSDIVSDLTFLYNDNNIKDEDKENLGQALDRFTNKI